jgi:HTH-type transcriptional regulator/antitoxin HigA
MNTLSQIKEKTVQTINHWRYVEDYAKLPNRKNEYEKQRVLLEALMALPEPKKDKHIINLIQLIARNIQVYENQHFLTKQASALDVLKLLMDEHCLTQSDLPEIGSQSLVSKILLGERKLTAEQIGKLARRFHVSPAVFYDV